MKISELKTDIQRLLDDAQSLELVQRQLEKTRLALNRSEMQVLKLQERLSKMRGRGKKLLDPIDEENLFQTHTTLRFTSHINGVRALHIKAMGFGKTFTTRDSGDAASLLGEAVEYLRKNVWKH